jgi:hypothetical protein
MPYNPNAFVGLCCFSIREGAMRKLIIYGMALFVQGVGVCPTAVGQPSEHTAGINWFIGLGFTDGGDELAKTRVDYNGDSENDKVRAGNLVTLTTGAVINLPVPQWSVQASAGYHFDIVNGEDGDILFDRYPLELIPFYYTGYHRFGAGLSYHLSPELDLKDVDGPKVKFDDAVGWLVEYDLSISGWGTPHGLVFGLRYMWIDYKVRQVDDQRVSGFKFDGDHYGFHLNWIF